MCVQCVFILIVFWSSSLDFVSILCLLSLPHVPLFSLSLSVQHTDLCQYMDKHPGGLHPDNVRVSEILLTLFALLFKLLVGDFVMKWLLSSQILIVQYLVVLWSQGIHILFLDHLMRIVYKWQASIWLARFIEQVIIFVIIKIKMIKNCLLLYFISFLNILASITVKQWFLWLKKNSFQSKYKYIIYTLYI